mmetsp:Transcript_79392/g.222961  ORF Transcript_79392/g.222961 Transcript_79392/m.222961 type:complete len:81 (-) Transcript_79392:1818-2060(-)
MGVENSRSPTRPNYHNCFQAHVCNMPSDETDQLHLPLKPNAPVSCLFGTPRALLEAILSERIVKWRSRVSNSRNMSLLCM